MSQLKRNNEPNTSKNEVRQHDIADVFESLKSVKPQDVQPSTTSSSLSSPSTRPAQTAVRSISATTSTTPRTESPYLNIRQSNVGLTPLLNQRKRKPDAEVALGFSNVSKIRFSFPCFAVFIVVVVDFLYFISLAAPTQQLTIFNNPRKVSKTVSKVQSSSQIYNGFGGSERKENFVGFPNGQSKSNPAGRGLSTLVGSSKSGVATKK